MQDRSEVVETLTTMLEGDDLEFEPLEPDDIIWSYIGYPTFAADPPDDIEEWVESLPEAEYEKLVGALKENGYLTP